jgi:hypothetical protein
MIKKLHRYKSQIAIILIAAISSVFLCDYLCNINIISINTNGYNKANDHNPLGASHQDHNQSSENGCEDLTGNLYNNLMKYKVEPTVIAAKHVLYAIVLPVLEFNFDTQLTKETSVYFNLPPPLKGSEVRVLIQSFLL